MARKKTLYCSVCKSEIGEEDKFCENCGTIFDDVNDDEIAEIKTSDDYKIIKTYIRLSKFSEFYKCISIIAAVLLFIFSIINIKNNVLFIYQLIISVIFFIMGFVADLFFKWLSYMLKLNYKRTKK